ncbi:hypothetical protein LCGC14_2397410, partial [marine sediment metagenome]
MGGRPSFPAKEDVMRLIDEAWGDWDSVRSHFRWQVPEHFNIAQAVCDRHVGGPETTALFYEHEDGRQEQYSFRDIQRKANQFANVLVGLGIERGDRVGIVLPQRPETAIAHLAIYKTGAIAVPLAVLFGTEALRYRLPDCSAKAVIVGADDLHKIHEIRDSLESLRKIILVAGQPGDDEIGFADALAEASDSFATARTRADDPCIIIYTSGTTGNPKGALHAHRYLLGHLPGFELSHNFFPQSGDLCWTAADWAWIGGLMDLLMPSWFYGKPVVAYRGRKFDPEQTLALLARHGIRNIFMPPSGLKMLRQVDRVKERFGVKLRTIMSGGEALGTEVLNWAREQFDVAINEIYGQTEVNYVVGNCARIMEVRPGSMGKPYPGHIVDIIDADGNALPRAALKIVLPERDQLFIARGRASLLTIDFDLEASHTVDVVPTPALATSEPFIVAEIDPVDSKDIRVRGRLIEVNETDMWYAVRVRPFHDHANDFGRMKVNVTDETEFEVNDEPYKG